jgi:3-deoxy-manno-octulosonate cytidylyltransferase (CMP-KDO synthetase)
MTSMAVIPARFASTRFPGKPLAADTGKYLIQHVYERAREASSLDRVVVATDDERIVRAVESFGGEAVMTRGDHATGTDRVAEVAAGADCDIVINVQGDEPEIEPSNIDRLVALLSEDQSVPIATLACPFAVLAGGDPRDPNTVKVVRDLRGRAIYFSRSLIPYPRMHDSTGATHQPAPYLLHLGIYAYRRACLRELAKLPPTALERTEMLEQLRWMENGYAIAVGIVDRASVGIDTPGDYAAFIRRYSGGAAELRS